MLGHSEVECVTDDLFQAWTLRGCEIVEFAVDWHVQALHDGDQVRLVLRVEDSVPDEKVDGDGRAGGLFGQDSV